MMTDLLPTLNTVVMMIVMVIMVMRRVLMSLIG